MIKMKKLLPYVVVNLLIFYVLPILIRDTSSGMLILMIIIPLITFGTSLLYGLNKSFGWRYPLLVMGIFLPSIFLYYNESALVYTLIYGGLSLLGSFIGSRCQAI